MRFDTKLEYETSDGYVCKYIAEHPFRTPHSHIFVVANHGGVYFADDQGYCANYGATFQIREKKKKIVRWLNIFPAGYQHASTKEEADKKAYESYRGYSSKRIACVKVEFEEGEGL